MHKGISLLSLSALMFTGTLLAEQRSAPATLSQAEVDSVVQQFESAFVSAYNGGDAKAVGGMYTENATVLGEYGALGMGASEYRVRW